MGYEWFALAATAGLGLAGIVATSWQAKQGRDHDRRMAREERQQERLADAYVGLLRLVGKAGAWAQTVKPMLDTIPPREPPPLPEVEPQLEAEAIVNAYGSEEVRELFEDWRRIVGELLSQIQLLDFARDDRERGLSGGPDYGELHEKLQLDLRPKELEARVALARRVNMELRPASD